MQQGSGELSNKAGQIADDFMGRCRLSATQGVHACETGSVVEDRITRVTPVEPAYVFTDRQEALAVSRHLESQFTEQGFEDLEVRVVAARSGADEYHIQIRAAW